MYPSFSSSIFPPLCRPVLSRLRVPVAQNRKKSDETHTVQIEGEGREGGKERVDRRDANEGRASRFFRGCNYNKE